MVVNDASEACAGASVFEVRDLASRRKQKAQNRALSRLAMISC